MPLSSKDRSVVFEQSLLVNRVDPPKADGFVADVIQEADGRFRSSSAPPAFQFQIGLKSGAVASICGKWMSDDDAGTLMWHAMVDGRCSGFGVFARDDEYDGPGDRYYDTLRERAAYLSPQWRGQGMYSTLLRALSEAFGERLYADALSTADVRWAWIAASDGEPFAVTPTGQCQVRSIVPVINFHLPEIAG